MNVIMPVAMTTMHTDPESAARSATTAKRGIRVLQALLLSSSSDIPQLLHNVQAIWEVAGSSSTTLEDDEAMTFTVRWLIATQIQPYAARLFVARPVVGIPC